MVNTIFKRIAPIAALAMAVGLSGCDDISMDMTINGEEGVPLEELDMSGPAPTELVVSANATVVLTVGDTLDISVEGDTENALRFVNKDGTLGITLDPDLSIKNGNATVSVTMPAPEAIAIGGSGRVQAETIASDADLVIGGSGSINAGEVAAESLEVSIGGSGSVTATGTTESLAVNIGGSGSVEMPGLKAGEADVNVGGAGDVSFASDGEVTANIAGSGDINVTGNATCTLNSFGSGSLNCGPAEAAAETPAETPDEGSEEEAAE